MELVDSHCHLRGLSEEQLACVLSNAAAYHVTQLVCIGAGDGIESTPEAIKLAETHPSIWATVGIHPHDADTHIDLGIFESLLDHSRVVAVGETGLDFFRDWADFSKQEALFRNSIAVAKNAKKPLVIHCREAQEQTISLLEELKAEVVGGVFHCYAGDAEFAKRLVDMNFCVSFTGSLTFKSAHALREIAKAIPLSQILVETDSPYMAPEPFRGKPSEPMHVYQVALKLAEIKSVSIEEVAKVTSDNARRLFRI